MPHHQFNNLAANPADSVSEFNPILHKGFGINESHSVIFGK